MNNLEVINQDNVQLSEDTVKIIDDQTSIDSKYNVLNNSQYILNDNNIKIVNTGTLKILDTNAILDMNNMKLIDANTVSNTNNVKIIDKNILIQYDTGSISNTESNNIQQPISTKRKRDDKSTSTNITSLNNLNSIEPRKAKTKLHIVKKYQNPCEDLDETNINLPFIKWLASITERINQTMHFQFDGKPDPLVFHVPQIFFDCLRERISCGGKKKTFAKFNNGICSKRRCTIRYFY